jgi:hypothetical protein
MKRVDIIYKREPTGADVITPPSEIIMSNSPWAKGAAFGLDIGWSYSLTKVQSRNLIVCMDTRGNIIREYARNRGIYTIPLGFSIKLPDGFVFYAHSISTGSMPYIIEGSSNEFLPVALYLGDNGFPLELKPKEVLLKMIPIIDEDYHFEYSPVKEK